MKEKKLFSLDFFVLKQICKSFIVEQQSCVNCGFRTGNQEIILVAGNAIKSVENSVPIRNSSNS